MKKILKMFFRMFLGQRNYGYIKIIGIRSFFKYFLFQRIFRINSHVPWPCHWSSIVTNPDKITINYHRPFPGFMPGQYIQSINGIEIGKNLRLAPGVKIVSASHNLNNYDVHDEVGPIKIGDNCWIAANAIILPCVELGDHTVVAAGAVVNKSFPEGNCVLGGVPAKIIKKLGDYEG